MVAYNGNIVYTDSEWSAFVNPWTQQIEMIVGRHSVRADSLMPIEMFEASCPTMPSKLSESEMRLVDSELRALLAQPVRSVNEMKHNLEPVATVSSYIDKIVETLVNGSNDPNEVQQQQVLTSTRISPPTVDSPQSAASLSYNQINCLENVNRLLKSQTEVQTRMSRLITDSTGLIEEQIPLTKEVLQQHNKKWEEECKYTWKNRLALKRSADNITTVEPEAKFPRIDLTSRMQHVPLISDNTTTGQHNLINICVPKQTYDVYRQLPQATSVLQSEQSIYTTFWLDYLTAIQLQAQNYNQINF
uniref:Period n=1 Tax=Acrobeloides nanus TaxID=290746 RepID=A0A914E7A0_9BILA